MFSGSEKKQKKKPHNQLTTTFKGSKDSADPAENSGICLFEYREKGTLLSQVKTRDKTISLHTNVAWVLLP